jgi:hypothetical protein
MKDIGHGPCPDASPVSDDGATPQQVEPRASFRAKSDKTKEFRAVRPGYPHWS